MNKGRYSISAFFPAYNDAGSIVEIVRKTMSMLPKVADDYEIVVVDDGSTDETGALLEKLAGECSFLRIIHHGVNRGYGAALITGFANCSRELIFYTDGDGQYDVEEMPSLLKAFGEGTDVVNGYKISRSDPWYRIVAGSLYRHLMHILFRLKIKDVDCDFRLFRRDLLSKTCLTFDSGVICVEMIKRFQDLGCTIVEVPVHHYHRHHGSSQFFRFKHLRRVFVQLIVAWWRLVIRREHRKPSDMSGLGVEMPGVRSPR